MITPIQDRVLIKPDAAKEKTDSGIHLAPSAVEKPLSGTVVAVGEGIYSIQTGLLIPTKLKVGDNVLHSKYGYTDIELEGQKYLIMKESDVFAII